MKKSIARETTTRTAKPTASKNGDALEARGAPRIGKLARGAAPPEIGERQIMARPTNEPRGWYTDRRGVRYVFVHIAGK